MKNNKKIFVKIHRERGYGQDAFPVVRDQEEEYVLRDKTGAHFHIYKKHCYQDHKCKMLSR